MAKIFLKKNEEHRIKNGHLWIFSNEVDKIKGEIENGGIAEVYDNKNNFLGSGFYNKNSLITVRLFGKSYEGDFNSYVKEKLLKAYELRKLFYPHRESFRLVFSESDYLQGLIIDKYNNTYVLQINSFGMQKNINSVVDIIRREFKAKNIFTRNESYFRKLEGLSESDDVYLGNVGEEIIDDGKIKYRIDFTT
ncbi:MAG: class I SAM-dependent rRNA methyltransferase, partial [Ignavibacteria bacterium]